MQFPHSRSLSTHCLYGVLGLSLLIPIAPRPALAQAQVATAPARPQGYEPPEISVEEFVRMAGEPTRVTFSGNDIAPEEAAVALLAAANVPPTAIKSPRWDKVPAAISVNWKNTSFWDAAKEFESLTGLRWSGPYHLPFYPITLHAPRVEQVADLNGEVLAQLPCVRLLLSPKGLLNLYLDPKLSVQLAYIKDVEGLRSDQQYVLEPLSLGQSRLAHGYISARSGQKGLPFAGTLHLHVFSTMETLHLPKLEVGASTTLPDGSSSLTVRDVTYKNNELQVKFTLRRPHGPVPSAEYYRSLTSLTMRDAAGNVMRQTRSSSSLEPGVPNTQSEWINLSFINPDFSGIQEDEGRAKGPFSFDWAMPKDERCVNIPVGKR